ncbi:hypothetical protein E8E12_003877 [Didymella heteroderae]|uniref:F-box domain-containing protein n=1 Tax=Didymella heteroderae TaxID=1769908 RepID=A0A9P5BVL0_9PLEO|nr:hypothetical protein E8E12_003877 [Didymella heteroderae]
MHSNGDAKPKSGTSYSSPPSPIGHQEQFMPADNRAATATTTKTPKTVNIAAALPTWTPNTGIIDLPNEILRDIFLSVDEAFSCTLWSLSLTCKHFRAIVEEHCEPEYNLRGKKLENPVELLELLCDRPHLRNSIRVANIQYQHDFVTCGTPADTLALVNRLGLAAVYEELLDFTGEEGQIDSAAALLVVSLPKLETFHD